MQRLRNVCTFTFILFIFIALVGFPYKTSAEQLNKSVKECLENPKECNKPSLDSPESELDTPKQVKDKTVGVNAYDYLRMIFATMFVVALLYFMLKYINKKSQSYKSNSLINNIGGTSLGANRSIQLIKVGETLLVVGVGETIQLLKEINDAEEIRLILDQYNQKMDQLVQPSDIVTKLLERAKKKTTNHEQKPFESILKKQLEDITQGRKELYGEMEKKGQDER